METQLGLNEIKLDRHALGPHEPAYQVTFRMQGGSAKGALTVIVPVESASDVDVVTKARELLKEALLSLADEVERPSKIADQDISEMFRGRAGSPQE